MTEIMNLYHSFWNNIVPHKSVFSDFLLAFPEGNVPLELFDGTRNVPLQPPYITYTLSDTAFFGGTLETARIWTRSKNILQVSGFTDYVKAAIPHGGIVLSLPDNKGSLYIRRPTPPTKFCQLQPMDESDIKVMYITLEVENYIY
ncbi:MAG: hypothetical protein FWH02_01530 [Oscillospiraceae bacterium]|nr:hypothetical protein [Oscillospiraceae bacterium]